MKIFSKTTKRPGGRSKELSAYIREIDKGIFIVVNSKTTYPNGKLLAMSAIDMSPEDWSGLRNAIDEKMAEVSKDKSTLYNPTVRKLLAASAKIEIEGSLDHNATLFQILEAKAKVTFHDGSGIEYAEFDEPDDPRYLAPYIKAIGPGGKGKAWVYPFEIESLNDIMDGPPGHCVNWMPPQTK